MIMWGRRLAQSIGSTHSFVVRRGRWQMSTILIIVLLILLLGGGGGYYGYNRYGGAGLGGALGLVLIILLVLWFLAVCVSKAADLDACVGRCVDFFTIRGRLQREIRQLLGLSRKFS